MSICPKSLHLFWHSYCGVESALPTEVRSALQSWRRIYPQLAVRIWGDYHVSELLKAEFDEGFLESYRLCRFPEMRADFSRAIVLAARGGAFIDARCLIHRPLPFPVGGASRLVLLPPEHEDPNLRFGTEFVLAPPGHPAVWRLAKNLRNRVQSRMKGSLPQVTGGVAFNSTLRDLDNFEYLTLPHTQVWGNDGLLARLPASYQGPQQSQHWSQRQRDGLYSEVPAGPSPSRVDS